MPPERGPRTPRAADERSVDMDERRDPPPADESSRPVAVSTPLPEPKRAWSAYVRHSRGCAVCRDVDQHCGEADGLWRAWQTQARRALQELG